MPNVSGVQRAASFSRLREAASKSSAEVIASRRGGDPDRSYVARLFHKGTDTILKKVGEEATEVVIAAKDGDPAKIVYEVADLWFHSIVMLGYFDIDPQIVLNELARRQGLSGLVEKANRAAH